MIQRITSTIKIGTMPRMKRNQFFKEVKMVFREDGDFGDVRVKPVASQEQLSENLDSLLSKWQLSIPKVTVSAIERSKDHLKCVEKLKVNQGTSKNETVHGLLNTNFKKRKYISPDYGMKIVQMSLLQYNNNKMGVDDPLFTLKKDDCYKGSINFSELGLTVTTTESFFPPATEHGDKSTLEKSVNLYSAGEINLVGSKILVLAKKCLPVSTFLIVDLGSTVLTY